MNTRKVFQLLWVACLIIAASLSCKLITNPIEDAVEKPLKGIITEADIEGIITEADIEGLVTQVDIEGMATQMEGMLTEIATQIPLPGLTGGTPENVPADIPIMAGAESSPFASPGVVSYSISAKFKDVVDFYEVEMHKNGWQKDQSGSKVEGETATLYFTKGSRKATINITYDSFFEEVTVEIKVEGG